MKYDYEMRLYVPPDRLEDELRAFANDGWRMAYCHTDGHTYAVVMERETPDLAPTPELEMRQENVFDHAQEKLNMLAADGWRVVSAVGMQGGGGTVYHNLILQRPKPPGCDHDWEDGFSMNGPTKTCRKCGKFMRD